ncbi:MAG TPA: FAD-binding oxidoreductase [Gemmatimonadales bacterium]|nr:FAD-binding oxidoreductase [Gemmatimonadales bacterium]
MPSEPRIRGPFRTDERARAAYAEAAGIYRIIPRAVALPADLDDLVALIHWAARERVPVVPRGAGSAMGGGNVGNGVVVDLTRMAGPALEVRPGERRARMRAGATLGELEAATAPHGLRLPPDPSSWRWATAGGVVSTNAAGARSVRYGSVRRWVEALTLVTADGEITRVSRGGKQPSDTPAAALGRFQRDAAPAIRAATDAIAARFPRTRKSSTGYALDAYLRSGDVLDLIVGAEGTLGFVTEVEWRLDPTPLHRAGLRILLPDYRAIESLVTRLVELGAAAVELLDRTFLDLVAAHGGALADTARSPGVEAVLLVELEAANQDEIRELTASAVTVARVEGLEVDAALSPEGTTRLWQLRHAASPILAGLPPERRSLQVIEDGCVPVSRLGDYIAAIRRAASARGLTAVIFGHAGDGNVHVNLLPELARPGWERDVAALLEEVTEAVIRLGGVPSGEHGDGRLRAGFLERVYGAEIVSLFRDVKTSFDPLGIMNPGIILPSGEPPISRLKAGDGAVSLPTDIARALRDIEQSGGYARSRLEIADQRPAPPSR